MVHRYLPFASFLGALLFSGCVIYTEPEDQNQAAPPPPPPPHQAQPAQPPTETVSGKVPSKTQPPAQPQPEPGGLQHNNWLSKVKIGKIVVHVTGGSCDIGIDGKSQGIGTKANTKIGAGDHEVTCQPTGGKLQTESVSVAANEEVTVTFDLANPSNTTNVSKPLDTAPPVGRPTPGQ
jgi:hypothetical protein